MVNFTTIYNEFVRANLPLGMTYSGNRYRYNSKSFPTFLRAYWYYLYIQKLGSESEYIVNNIEPQLVADFTKDFYTKTGA